MTKVTCYKDVSVHVPYRMTEPPIVIEMPVRTAQELVKVLRLNPVIQRAGSNGLPDLTYGLGNLLSALMNALYPMSDDDRIGG